MSAKYAGIQVKYKFTCLINILWIDILQKRPHQTIIGLTRDRGLGKYRVFFIDGSKLIAYCSKN